jgi:hypothetical protein
LVSDFFTLFRTTDWQDASAVKICFARSFLSFLTTHFAVVSAMDGKAKQVWQLHLRFESPKGQPTSRIAGELGLAGGYPSDHDGGGRGGTVVLQSLHGRASGVCLFWRRGDRNFRAGLIPPP